MALPVSLAKAREADALERAEMQQHQILHELRQMRR